MPKPNQSANWDFRFNRKSPSQKKKNINIYIYIYIYIKTRVSHKNSDSCMTNGGQLLKLKKCTTKSVIGTYTYTTTQIEVTLILWTK